MRMRMMRKEEEGEEEKEGYCAFLRLLVLLLHHLPFQNLFF